MIGLFLCWVAGSYWKKIYYIYITVQELLMILGFTLASTMGEEGDYDPVTGGEKGIIVLMFVFLIIMLILYAKDTRIADVFNMFIIMCISLKFFDITHIVSKIHAIFTILFWMAAVFVAIFVYCSDSYSAVLPSSYFAVFAGMFWIFFIKESDFVSKRMEGRPFILGIWNSSYSSGLPDPAADPEENKNGNQKKKQTE